MKNPLSKNWSQFCLALLKWTIIPYVAGLLWIGGGDNGQYWVPFALFSFFFLSGLDMVVDRILLKKQLLQMRKWTKDNGVPIVVGVTLATLALGLEHEEIFFMTIGITLLIFITMAMGVAKRYLRINKHLGINILEQGNDQ